MQGNCPLRTVTYYLLPTLLEPSSNRTGTTQKMLGCLLKGELLLTVDDATTTVSTGQWYYVPANKEHSAEFREDTC